jgi:hypothetical protein
MALNGLTISFETNFLAIPPPRKILALPVKGSRTEKENRPEDLIV